MTDEEAFNAICGMGSSLYRLNDKVGPPFAGHIVNIQEVRVSSHPEKIIQFTVASLDGKTRLECVPPLWLEPTSALAELAKEAE